MGSWQGNTVASVVHELCGRRHSTEELVTRCVERLEKLEADEKRRLDNEALMPVDVYIRERRLDGATFEKIAAELKRDYPEPEDGPWHHVKVVMIDSVRLNW